MIALASRDAAVGIAGDDRSRATVRTDLRQMLQGTADVFRHWWLTLRTSVLGTVIGIIPGLGGETAAWLCYAHAAQTTRHPETPFGEGAIEGVIGPEAANNSKEGGSLAPTLMLGLPGSAGMAVLLVAFEPLGISPGPALIGTDSHLLWLMVWTLVFSNIIAAAMLMGLTPLIGKVSRIDSRIIAPFVILLCFVSIHLSTHQPEFFMVAALLGMIGYAMHRAGWPRAPFAIGAVLGPVAEDALYKSIALWGPDFLLRPGTLLLIAVLVLGVWRARRSFTNAIEAP
jgi:TctA family transporter